MICVVDYEAGNLKSVELVLRHLGADFKISKRPEDLAAADRLIFPGVGEAFSSMKVLSDSGLGSAVKEFAATGRPLLGICVGCQVLFDFSEERSTGCLSVLPGKVVEFPADSGLKVPHMGWNQVAHGGRHQIFDGIPDNSSFYFVHSYYPVPASIDIEIGRTEYGIGFTSAVARDNVVATQFHPEKSGEIGLKLIQNFINL